ncbi:unnamed protein product [Spirodela intermedia]|uniref:Protein kinase domain-containing protein n=1 Tax=Spirodela intermedia TaxID=51605 RepID=A0A7I8IEW8_SPIIN|nr:unnamed protein product [Spirodela intermedia]CAA6656229.1 unnamed protein product [Spirodela intermedia]
MELKASLDPDGQFLTSWTEEGDPCGGTLKDNISLQGKRLPGTISPAVGRLQSLSGLFLHYNELKGVIPPEIANLTELTDLYLNVNNLSGSIPPAIGNMARLQVLQLCYNRLSGSIPNQVGLLKELNVLALQSNRLTGAIPASLGDLPELTRLDLSFNQFFGSIPPSSPWFLVCCFLSGEGLRKMEGRFHYANNRGLCGAGFSSLRLCNSADLLQPNKPEPYSGLAHTGIPQLAYPSSSSLPVVIAAIAVGAVGVVSGLLAFACYRRRKQKIGSSIEITDSRLSTDQVKEAIRKSPSAPVGVGYTSGWDSLAGGGFSQDVSRSLRFNLEEVESATQHFSEVNLLGKSNFAATYKGILRDGSVVAVKSINKTSCKAEEGEFLKGLKLLASLSHENLVGLRGFCCSSGRGECFLVYDFVANGSLSQYLETKGKEESSRVLGWPQRVAIIKGIARGIEYLHSDREKKPALVHQNISSEKILIDHHFKPLISGAGFHKLLADDVVFSSLKASAAMGYLAPEYATTGRFSEKSDVYAFGVILLQILTGRTKVNPLRPGAEPGKLEDLIDRRLEGNYPKPEAAKLASLALVCTSETPTQRPTMSSVVQELCCNNS